MKPASRIGGSLLLVLGSWQVSGGVSQIAVSRCVAADPQTAPSPPAIPNLPAANAPGSFTIGPRILPPPIDDKPAREAPGRTVEQTGHTIHRPASTAVPPPHWPDETVPPAPVPPMSATNAVPSSTPIRLVNSKRIVLNYEVKNVGPSGVTAVELWCTRDGRTWTKIHAYQGAKPPCIIDVEDEDLYGFTMVVRSGVGLARTPQEGDRPQVWVEVDTTKPFVRLMGVEAGRGTAGRNLTILWKATDKNLGPQPISLLYATRPEGPWLTIASQFENTGRYVWQIPPEVPHNLLIRVEAVDLVGNIGHAQTPNALLDDLSQPTATILAVEGKSKIETTSFKK